MSKAFLVDLSEVTDRGDKYLFLVLTMSLMIDAVQRSDKRPVYYFQSEPKIEGVIEIVDMFHTAFSDIPGLPAGGIARITTRLFLTYRGLEVFVWTTGSEQYSIFVNADANQIANTVLKFAKGIDDFGEDFEDLLLELSHVEHSFIFPSYEHVRRPS